MGLSASWYRADTALFKQQERGQMGGVREGAEIGMSEYSGGGKVAQRTEKVQLQIVMNV